jgi:membrane dipeptidase
MVGVEHVGIGLDISFHEPALNDTPPNFDPRYWWPASAGYGQGLKQICYTPMETWSALPAALEKSGMSTAEANLVMGGNMRSVAAQVWG